MPDGVGEAAPRHDATPKVTGEFAYSSDLSAAGMLWGVTVRSPHAHARIMSIDVSEALGMAGVHAVLTHGDVPGQKTYGLEFDYAIPHARQYVDYVIRAFNVDVPYDQLVR